MKRQLNTDDRKLFEDLVESHWDEILTYLWRMFSGAPEAEDCFQETFLRAYRAFPDLDRDANVRAWLYRIATNVSRTHFKRNHDRRRREILSGRGLSASSDSTHERVQDRMLFARVVEMVWALPVKQRAAFMLRKYHGCSYDEIGEVLDCSREAARANVYQALRKLKTEAKALKDENR